MPANRMSQYVDVQPGDKIFSSIAVIGGGVSLDFCEAEIRALREANTLFLLSDRIANEILRQFNLKNRIILSVETRYHEYLHKLKNEEIWAWEYVNLANINEHANRIIPFRLKGVSKPQTACRHGEFAKIDLNLPSPGTVGGAGMAAAIHIALNSGIVEQPVNVVSVGLDFCYPDQRSVSRFGYFPFFRNRFETREGKDWKGVLARTIGAFMISGSVVRTSEEFYTARQNLHKLISNTAAAHPGKIQFIDYSIPGLELPFVERRVPRMLQFS